jgi:hypothetical protein
MKHNNSKNIIDADNIIGDYYHKKFLEFQAKTGFKITGGSAVTNSSEQVKKRLVTDINLLNSKERKSLLESGNLFNN